MRSRTTKQHEKYWRDRKIDWKKEYFDTHDHPHRQLIINELKRVKFGSLLEVGCASGPNLHRIKQEFPGVQIGGVDISQDAIDVAKKLLPANAILDVQRADQLMFGDKSVDVIISDMALIYLNLRKLKECLRRMRLIGRKKIILCEFHSENLWKRVGLRWAAGYYAYNYRKLLEKIGFWDVTIKKIPEEAWPGGEPQKTFGYIITADM